MSKKAFQVYSCAQGADEKLLFPPQAQTVEEAQIEVNKLLAGDPAQYGVSQTRWTLETLLSKIRQKGYTLSKMGNLHRFLSRLGIRRNQVRYSYRSPDKHYREKLEYIENILKRVKESNGKELLFYLDEFSYYHQPLLTKSWTRSNQKQEKVRRALAADTRTRVLGVINATNGRVHYFQAPKISVSDTVSFCKKLCESYPEAERLWVVQNNNPVHFHPNLCVGLEEQETPFPIILPPNWLLEPKKWAIDRFQKWHLPIQLVQLHAAILSKNCGRSFDKIFAICTASAKILRSIGQKPDNFLMGSHKDLLSFYAMSVSVYHINLLKFIRHTKVNP